MLNNSPSKTFIFFHRVLQVLLYGVLVTPLLLSSRFFFPYISTKTFYFRFIIEIAAAIFVLLVLSWPKFRPRLNRISWAVFVYGGIALVTSLFGVNFYRSFWGNSERGEGLLTLFHLICYFLLVLSIFRTNKDWERYFTFSVLVSFASAVYATMQKFGASFVTAGDVSRVSAAIGNASFYAGYLVIHIFLAIWLSTRFKKNWQKFAMYFIVAYQLYILNDTGTRGAIIGLLAGLAILFTVYIFGSSSKKIKLALAAIAVVIVGLGALVWVYRWSDFVYRTPGLYRVSHLSFNDVTTESRLLTWQSGWRGWQDRLIRGYGYENFNIAFNRYFEPKIFRDSGSQIWFDRAHNIVFDVGVQTGVFGLLAYFSLFILSFWELWRYFKADPKANKMTSVIFSAILLSYFIQNLFVFDTLGTYLLFFAILAFIGFLRLNRKNELPIPDRQEVNWNIYSLLTAVLVLVFVSFFAVFNPIRANFAVINALNYSRQGQFEKSSASFRKAISYGTYVTEEARQKFAETVLTYPPNLFASDESRVRAFRQAISDMQEVVKQAPNDARDQLYLISLYNNLPTREVGPKEEVLRLGKKALALSPTRPQIYFEMGQAAYALGRADESIADFKKGLALNTFPAESHWNLALAYVLTSHFPEADKELDYVFLEGRIKLINESSLRYLANLLSQKNDAVRVARVYEAIIDLKPEDVLALRAQLAGAYGQLCELDKAASQLNQIAVQNPSAKDSAVKLIEEMRQKCR